ncbi:TPR domain-containing protein [Naegleria gruberi]|uniref:TPR domain-containing protein n=1 Tax=Naegleria gruberi TaxID=5762 RepID=D2VXH7_NAEGR|nr:TPR domain-containing protein [Naegleria gruberi]EFC38509.1 TPR domain-containing protein [Naegleria gruberi]|eukprot:XP_002671253.1 TPR domain-containing protein [Naegleria gruberi strain NEG-M]
MCGGAYAPPLFLLPVIFLIKGVQEIGSGIKAMDEAIKANNLKMFDLFKRKKQQIDQAASNQVEKRSTISITEIKKQSEGMSDDDKDKLATLLVQRCVARLEGNDFDLAKEDLHEALSLMNVVNNGDSKFYLLEYLLGICCYGNGEYKEAANYFQKSIDHRISLETELVENQNAEQSLLDLEEKFFSMQLEAKKPIEKIAASWSRNWSYYSTSVTNFTNQAKNYYNHSLMLGTDKPVLKTKPNTYITLELLYIRAGVAYYSGTYYLDAIPYFNQAIELGESYHSEYVESSYYNRGLCYYYLGELQLAINDFTKSISLMPLLKQRDIVYTMRAVSYGRLGLETEKKSDEHKAKLLNPFAKPLPLFHLRLLNEDALSHIMSFLQTKQLLVVSSLNKYTRMFIKKYLQENDIHISCASLITTDKKAITSLVKNLFLPKEETPNKREMMLNVLNIPLLQENAKNLIIYDSSEFSMLHDYGYDRYLEHVVITKFKNLKRLVFHNYHTTLLRTIPTNNP